jgi:hypothetical protein
MLHFGPPTSSEGPFYFSTLPEQVGSKAKSQVRDTGRGFEGNSDR